ncbi:MAG TPA: hypothetical protein VNL18_04425 [Gemmatimonadales bacterium]|nr:hypothetical protein [Gemmatimonadales bacterium]
MTDHSGNDAELTEAERLFDLYLATLPRFEPGPGFSERVMAQLVGHPDVALVERETRRAAQIVPAVLRRPGVGWGLAGSAALTSAALTAWTIPNLEAIGARLTSAMTVALAGWPTLVEQLTRWSAGFGQEAAGLIMQGGPSNLAGALAGAALAIPVSVVGLMLAFRPATQARKANHGR